jgi:hypothetical protein
VVAAIGTVSSLTLAWLPTWLAIMAAGFIIAAGWSLIVGRFVRWLQTKRTWPARARILSVPAVFIGVPVVIILVAQAVTSSR